MDIHTESLRNDSSPWVECRPRLRIIFEEKHSSKLLSWSSIDSLCLLYFWCFLNLYCTLTQIFFVRLVMDRETEPAKGTIFFIQKTIEYFVRMTRITTQLTLMFPIHIISKMEIKKWNSETQYPFVWTRLFQCVPVKWNEVSSIDCLWPFINHSLKFIYLDLIMLFDSFLDNRWS
jgi:hypothetical protein